MCKHLGISKANEIMDSEMKNELWKEYYWHHWSWMVEIGGNTFRAIDSHEVSLVWYTAEIITWTKDDL